jgi:hypothetical protein
MQRIAVIPYRRFGTTYRSHLQQSGNRNQVRSIIIIAIVTVLLVILHIYELRSLYWSNLNTSHRRHVCCRGIHSYSEMLSGVC